jgi:hypothetical protein
MSGWLIGLVGLIYAGVCVDQYSQGNTGWAVIYFGYALANIGSIMVLMRL